MGHSNDRDLTRRGFLGLASRSLLGWGTFAAAAGTGSAAVARFMFPNVLYEPPSQVNIGHPSDYSEGTVDERFKDSHSLWVVRQHDRIFALIAVCTHLGCTPNWLPGEAKFKCPCHGSGFRMSGINFEGPAPRPLERAAVRVLEDGSLLVDKSRIFQFEKGQWEDPDSYVAVA